MLLSWAGHDVHPNSWNIDQVVWIVAVFPAEHWLHERAATRAELHTKTSVGYFKSASKPWLKLRVTNSCFHVDVLVWIYENMTHDFYANLPVMFLFILILADHSFHYFAPGPFMRGKSDWVQGWLQCWGLYVLLFLHIEAQWMEFLSVWQKEKNNIKIKMKPNLYKSVKNY